MRDRRSLTTATPATPALWPDVLIAYAAPALSAGAGGLLTGRPDLTVAALTSIAGTSALVAALTGSRLRRRGVRAPRAVAPPKAVRAVAAGLVGGGPRGRGRVPRRPGPGRMARAVPVGLGVARTPAAGPAAVRGARRHHHHLALVRIPAHIDQEGHRMIVVMGATGATGSALLHRLSALGEPTRALSIFSLATDRVTAE
ncbi:hypothetical protein ACIQWR_16330 [Streptomyces sp. NPDC098789]|uniref:hypothetical protein n=1 Tax=Streptomyces sp. NPDC098789 TaxID=3366098 RepID=UPI003819208D